MPPLPYSQRPWSQSVVVCLGVMAPLTSLGCATSNPPGPIQPDEKRSGGEPDNEDLSITDDGVFSSLRTEDGRIYVQPDGSCAKEVDISCPGPSITMVEQCDEGEAEPCSMKEVEGPRPSCNPPPPLPVKCPSELREAAKKAKKSGG